MNQNLTNLTDKVSSIYDNSYVKWSLVLLIVVYISYAIPNDKVPSLLSNKFVVAGLVLFLVLSSKKDKTVPLLGICALLLGLLKSTWNNESFQVVKLLEEQNKKPMERQQPMPIQRPRVNPHVVQPPSPPQQMPKNPQVQANVTKKQVNNPSTTDIDLDSLDDISYLSV